MPIVASLIKITALALALLCVDIKLMNAPIEMGSDFKVPALEVPALFRLHPVSPPGGQRHQRQEDFAVTAGSVHVSDRSAVERLARISRVAGTILWLAGIAVLVATFRYGVYEYFHGGGRALRGLSEVLMTLGGPSLTEIAAVALLGLATTSSVMLGAVLGLYVPFPKKVLAGVLAFAAGSLIAALAIELGFEGASDLIRHGASVHGAWAVDRRRLCRRRGHLLCRVAVPRPEGRRASLSVALSGIRPGSQAPSRRRKARAVVEMPTCCATCRPSRSNRCSIASSSARSRRATSCSAPAIRATRSISSPAASSKC